MLGGNMLTKAFSTWGGPILRLFIAFVVGVRIHHATERHFAGCFTLHLTTFFTLPTARAPAPHSYTIRCGSRRSAR